MLKKKPGGVNDRLSMYSDWPSPVTELLFNNVLSGEVTRVEFNVSVFVGVFHASSPRPVLSAGLVWRYLTAELLSWWT